MQIVKVRYFSETEQALSAREYTYFSEENLAVGDIVVVPVKDTTGKAKVTAIGVPEAEIEKFRAAVKTIKAGAKVPVETATPEVQSPSAEGPEVPTPIQSLAVIDIKLDLVFQNYKNQVAGVRDSAKALTIQTDADLKTATNDLAVIAGLKKGIDTKRQEYTKPLNDRVKEINDTFRELSGPIDEADAILREKSKKYNRDQDTLHRMAEAVNQQTEELARKQAELSGTGEITVELNPVVVPPAPAAHVRTDMATAGFGKRRRARVIDFAKLPDSYKLPNEKLLDAAARSNAPDIPGVEYYFEDTIRVTATR